MSARRQGLLAGCIARGGILAAAAVLVSACGSTNAGSGPAPQAGPAAARLPLATSLAAPGQPGWSVVPMGGSSKSHDNFWELFVRPDGSPKWKLATPLGVASNGGLAVAGSGTGLVAGFQPSQDLTFSPLASLANAAATWSQGSALVSPGLASVPDALAAGPAGQLLALTRTGEVLLSSDGGTRWTRLTALQTLEHTAAGRSCGLTALTAVAFSNGGVPLVAGSCARSATAGVFMTGPGTTIPAAGPALRAWPSRPTTVLGLRAEANRFTALVQLGSGRKAQVAAVWWVRRAGAWTVSATVLAGSGPPRSQAIWASGSAGVVLASGRAEIISALGSHWRSLPKLPAGTATLALGPAGQLEGIAASGGNLTVWQLSASRAGWERIQQLKVTIPYGSSG